MSALEYGWGEKGNQDDPFWVRFVRCGRAPKPWKEELYEAVRVVTNSAQGRPLWLCFSGGIDSEIMCQSFFDQGVHFSVLTIEHAAGTNRHDIAYAKKWCKEHGVEQRVQYLDMSHFLNVEVPVYADQGYITGNVFRYLQIKLLEEVEQLGGYAVLGDGEQKYEITPDTSHGQKSMVYMEFETGYAIPLEWSKKKGTSHEPYFYFSTPELCLSFLQIPIVDFAIRNPELFTHPKNSFLFNRLVYQYHWPAIEARQKYSGYEHIAPSRMEAQKKLTKKLGPKIDRYRLPISELLTQLSPPV